MTATGNSHRTTARSTASFFTMCGSHDPGEQNNLAMQGIGSSSNAHANAEPEYEANGGTYHRCQPSQSSDIIDVTHVHGPIDGYNLPEQPRFSDIITGKSRGLVVLLHGSPGTGRTLTAECVAERQGRPLHIVNCVNIGTEPRDLKRRLKEAFSHASFWNAILLLDEADIFLQERDAHNMARNAAVSILLREIDCFDGILFLTINRLRDIDKAFHSRIHMSIRLKAPDVEVRRQNSNTERLQYGAEDDRRCENSKRKKPTQYLLPYDGIRADVLHRRLKTLFGPDAAFKSVLSPRTGAICRVISNGPRKDDQAIRHVIKDLMKDSEKVVLAIERRNSSQAQTYRSSDRVEERFARRPSSARPSLFPRDESVKDPEYSYEGHLISIKSPATRDSPKQASPPMSNLHPSLASREPKASVETSKDHIELDSRYHTRRDARDFFVSGRVFALLWREVASDHGGGDCAEGTTLAQGKHVERVSNHIRRMVVLKECRGYCTAIPINTYSGAGIRKPGFSQPDRDAHAIVYMAGMKPTTSTETKAITRTEIVTTTSYRSTYEQNLLTLVAYQFRLKVSMHKHRRSRRLQNSEAPSIRIFDNRADTREAGQISAEDTRTIARFFFVLRSSVSSLSLVLGFVFSFFSQTIYSVFRVSSSTLLLWLLSRALSRLDSGLLACRHRSRA